MSDCCCSHGTTVPKLRLKVRPKVVRHGAHVPLKTTLLETVSQPFANICSCVQIYLGQRTGYTCRNLNQEDKEATLHYCKQHDKTFYVHCSLIANLANPTGYERSYNSVVEEIKQIKGL